MLDPSATTPLVSIIMPIRNEEKFIAQSLGSVLSQDYPHSCIEVLIADGMSTDNTRNVISQLANQADISVKIVDNPAKIVPTGFNLAIQHSRGDIVIRVDGHCELSSDYVTNCVSALERTGADCVGGAIETIGSGRQARAIATAQSSPFGVGGVAFRMEANFGRLVDTVAFGAYRREVFNRHGGLDEELVRNQDDEFNFRLIQAGGKIWLDPMIHSRYYSRASLRGLWSQYYQYGLYKVRVIQKRGAVPSWRHLAPAAFVTTVVLGLVLFVVNRRRIGLVPLLAYAIANISASLHLARRNSSGLPYYPLVFITLHFSYGLGFLAGLWKWRRYGFPNLQILR